MATKVVAVSRPDVRVLCMDAGMFWEYFCVSWRDSEFDGQENMGRNVWWEGLVVYLVCTQFGYEISGNCIYLE